MATEEEWKEFRKKIVDNHLTILRKKK